MIVPGSSLRRGAEKAEAVIHCAFDHDFSRFVENCQKDKRNIEAIGEALDAAFATDGPAVVVAYPAQRAWTAHLECPPTR